MNSSPHILLVDPDDLVAEECYNCFADQGWTMDRAARFSEALSLVEHSSYDVAIIELMLPDLIGIDAWKHLKAWQPNMGGIMTTRVPSLHQSVRISDGSILGYLVKPLPMDLVCNLIASVSEFQHDVSTARIRQQLRGLCTLIAALADHKTPRQIISALFSNLPLVLKPDWVVAHLLNRETSGDPQGLFCFLPPERGLSARQIDLIKERLDYTAQERQSVILGRSVCPNIEKPRLEEIGLRTLVAMPLALENESYGALAVVDKRGSKHEFTMIDMDLLTSVTRLVALALAKAQLQVRQYDVDSGLTSGMLSHAHRRD